MWEPEVRDAVRTALAPEFPRSHVVALCREVDRWLLKPQAWSVMKPCMLCGSSYCGLQAFRTDAGVRFAERGEPLEQALCYDCLSRAWWLLGADTALRAESALADIARALRARDAEHDAEALGELEARAGTVNPEPFAKSGRCSVCGSEGRRGYQAPAAILCHECLKDALALWTESCELTYSRGVWPARDRFEYHVLESGNDKHGAIFLDQGRNRLRIWIDALAARPREVFRWQLRVWDPPYALVEIRPEEIPGLVERANAIAKQKLGGEIVFRESE